MSNSQPQGLFKKHTLTSPEAVLVKQLEQLCETYEDLHMPLEWFGVLKYPGDTNNNFLYYEDGELVGYLAVNDRNPIMNELIGIVHPAYRRRGIFSQLLRAAQEECFLSGERRFILACEQTSHSGQAFMQAIRAAYMVSEYEMVLHHFRESHAFDERLTFRKAESSDLEAIIKIQAASFGDSQDHARHRVLHHAQDPQHLYYILTYGEESVGCQEPVGCLRLDYSEEAVGIFAVGILPDYQGRGYGRQMLEAVIRLINFDSQKPIFLDVNIKNTYAVNLYRSCGFTIRTTYDYYAMSI